MAGMESGLGATSGDKSNGGWTAVVHGMNCRLPCAACGKIAAAMMKAGIRPTGAC